MIYDNLFKDKFHLSPTLCRKKTRYASPQRGLTAPPHQSLRDGTGQAALRPEFTPPRILRGGARVFFAVQGRLKIFTTRKRLGQKFYSRETLQVAKELLGKFLIRKIGNKKIVGKIIETEAYIGPQDRASHAFRGKITKRNIAEYLIGGHIYIYLVYGMYWQLNISTAQAGQPECVLIRAVEPIFEFKTRKSKFKIVKQNPKILENLANGPGKLCQYLKLDKFFYGEDLTKSKKIWLEERGEKVRQNQIVSSPRIGIDYAGPHWAKKPWRFYIKDNKFVSRF